MLHDLSLWKWSLKWPLIKCRWWALAASIRQQQHFRFLQQNKGKIRSISRNQKLLSMTWIIIQQRTEDSDKFRSINHYPTKGLAMGSINLYIQPEGTATQAVDSRKNDPTHCPFWTGLLTYNESTAPQSLLTQQLHPLEGDKENQVTHSIQTALPKRRDLHGPSRSWLLEALSMAELVDGIWSPIVYAVHAALESW